MNAQSKNIVPAEQKSVLVSMASRYGMAPSNFEQTLRATVFPANGSKEQFAAFLVVANQYGLNPLTKEIYAFPTRAGGVQPIVSVDGWVNLVNSHSSFDGLEFDDHMDGNDKLVAITARIWRKDRQKPTVVTEYMVECARDTETWKKWPRRMLRHKAMIQCARYAFGFAGIVDPDEAERMGADVSPMRAVNNARDDGPPLPPIAKSIEHQPQTLVPEVASRQSDIELVEAGSADGRMVEWNESGEAPIQSQQDNTLEIPPSLDRRPKSASTESVIDSAAWRRDAEGALAGCEDFTSLFEVHKNVVDPAKGKVFPADWQAVALAHKQAFDRISMADQS